MNIDQTSNNRFSKSNKAIRLFLIVFGILSIETAASLILAYNLSADSGFWSIALFLYTAINFLLALGYILVSNIIGIEMISYHYTIVYTSVFAGLGIILNVLYYTKTYLISDKLSFLILGVFLVLHLIICLIRKYL